jgi:hypothetical protein
MCRADATVIRARRMVGDFRIARRIILRNSSRNALDERRKRNRYPILEIKRYLKNHNDDKIKHK